MRIGVCPQCDGPVDHEVGSCPADGVPGTVARGRLLGKYVIEEVIGRGGMGTVYQAKHVELESRVAIKVLDPRYSASADIVTRFFHEARAAAQIGHANIVQVLDFSRNAEMGDYIVMELLQGTTLGEVLDETPQLKMSRLLRLAVQICDGLGAAHKLGIIHRDLKPANVFLSMKQAKETVTLMDFGVAKIADARPILETLPGAVMGTPQYMSPEQWDGKSCDARSDVYSLGVVLYEAATGTLPFKGKTFAEVVKQQATVPVKPPRELRPELLPELEEIILRCLAMDPDERYATMEEVALHLRAARDELLRIRARREGDPTLRLRRRRPKNAARLSWIPAVMAVALVAGFAWISATRFGRNEREAAALTVVPGLVSATATKADVATPPPAASAVVVPVRAPAGAADLPDGGAASARTSAAPQPTARRAPPSAKKPDLLFAE